MHKYQISWKSLQWEPGCPQRIDRWTDEQTWRSWQSLSQFCERLKRAYYFARLYEYESLSDTVYEVRVWKRSKTRRDGEHSKEELELVGLYSLPNVMKMVYLKNTSYNITHMRKCERFTDVLMGNPYKYWDLDGRVVNMWGLIVGFHVEYDEPLSFVNCWTTMDSLHGLTQCEKHRLCDRCTFNRSHIVAL